MTYYEEFGISSSATPEEIRHAHRRLVKILHPDLHMEQGNRQLAEIQTRRVNGIAETLLDTARREAYNANLLPVKVPPPQLSYSLYAFALAILFFVGGLWLFQGEHPVLSAQAPAVSAPSLTGDSPTARPTLGNRKTPTTQATSSQHPNSGPATVTPPPISADQENKPTRGEQVLVEPEPQPARSTAKPSAQPTAETNPPKPTVAIPAQPENPLTGTWLYVPAPVAEADRNIYRPEYIEMRVRSVQGMIEGQYRARYHVPDRPLSPNVGFHFAGKPGPAATAFRWTGSNGVAGRVELKLISANSVQVNWRVTELAELADLVSGTAILTRVQ